MSQSVELSIYLDDFNKSFEQRFGYMFCRCYSCVFPILLPVYEEIKTGKSDFSKLGQTLDSINEDYLHSADYRMGKREKSGLRCGYDCIHYEECVEACPFPFWKIDKSNLNYLVNILEDCFSKNLLAHDSKSN